VPVCLIDALTAKSNWPMCLILRFIKLRPIKLDWLFVIAGHQHAVSSIGLSCGIFQIGLLINIKISIICSVETDADDFTLPSGNKNTGSGFAA